MPHRVGVRALLGQRLRAIRKLRGLTQEELGERAGVSGKFVGQIERGEGNPSLLVLEGLASALGLQLWEIVRFEGGADPGPVGRAAGATAAAERVVQFLAGRPPTQVERALRILEAALGDRPPSR